MLRRVGVPVVAVSEDLARFLSVGLGIARDQIQLVHNGIAIPAELESVDRAEARHAIGVPLAGPLLVAVGNLYPVKDHATLLRALAHLPDARVAIAGRGEEEPNLRALSIELGIESRVHLLGLRSDIDRVLTAADLFVQPSLSEGLPLAILEAMAAGLPIVATRVGGMAEAVVDGETGTLVAPAQPEQLAQVLGSMLADRDRLARMGRAGRQRAEREFSIGQMAKRYAALYASLRG